MKNFQERTEIIRNMIAQRMRQSPCSEDLSFTALQTWPDLFIWGFPEGMIFNIIVSCHLEIKRGYNLREAIRIVEECENSEQHNFPDTDLVSYIKYRLLKEYPQYVYLYSDSLVSFLIAFVENEMDIKITDFNEKAIEPSITVNTVCKPEKITEKITNNFLKKRNYRLLVVGGFTIIFVLVFATTFTNSSEKKAFDICPHFNRKELASLATRDYSISYFQKALNENTLDGWLEYREKVTENFKRDYVDSIIDQKRWEKALQLNTQEGYSEYIKQYNYFHRGRYIEEAEKKKIDLWVSNFFNSKKGKYEPHPKVHKVNSYNEDKSTIVITNATSYSLNIGFSGNDSKAITIEPSHDVQVTLLNGNYRIVAANRHSYEYSESIFGISFMQPKESATDILEYKIFVGEINLCGGLYKVTYSPYVPKPKPTETINLPFHQWTNPIFVR